MTYQVKKAEIILQCDGPKGGSGYCAARSSVSGASVGECFREARDEGWKLLNPGLWRTNLIANYAKMKCRCPDCAERSQRG